MDDPARKVPPQLLLHLHLISKFRYPQIQTASLDFILESLLQAPNVVRDVAAFSWTFVDAPPDGTLYLVYLSPLTQGKFPSDGYVWGDQEQAMQQQHNGYVIEMLGHQFGYNPFKESNQGPAAHSRRRYRLIAGPPNTPCNPNLWLVHYVRAQQMIPANRVPIGPHDHSSITQRKWLQQQGDLMPNKFMLNDAPNWPQIVMPNGQPQRMPGPMISFTNHPGVAARGHQMAQPDYGAEHPPSKRVRHNTASRGAAAGKAGQPAVDHRSEIEIEEEEYKDLHDYLTPKDISQMRYTQHHEWMEEIYSSYPTFAIKPVSLGLGRKGMLEPLTNGFFAPPRPPTPPGQSPTNDDAHYDDTIHKPLEPGKAEEFFQRATSRIEAINKEMDEMTARHEEHMKSFERIRALREAEKNLRAMVMPGEEGVNSEAAKIDGGKSQIHDPARGDATIAVLRQMDQIDIIAREMEGLVGKKIVKSEDAKLVQKGGLIEDVVGDALSNNKGQGGAGGNGAVPDLASTLFDEFLEPGSGQASLKPSVSPAPAAASPNPPPNAGDDWVVVNKPDALGAQGATSGAQSSAGSAQGTGTPSGAPGGSANAPLTGGGIGTDGANETPEDLGADLVDFGGDDGNGSGFATGAFDDAIDFGDIDNTAGDGLDAFGPSDEQMVDVGASMNMTTDAAALPGASQQVQATEGGGTAANVSAQPAVPEVPVGDASAADVVDVGGQMDMMEDSAFGDAFHAPETG